LGWKISLGFGAESQGHHANQAYYKSGIMSPEYPEQEDTLTLLAEFNKFLGCTLVAQTLILLSAIFLSFSIFYE